MLAIWLLVLSLLMQTKNVQGPGGNPFEPVVTYNIAFGCHPNDTPMLFIGLENCEPPDLTLPPSARNIYWFGHTSNSGFGGFLAAGPWDGPPGDGPNGPFRLDAFCSDTAPFFKTFHLLTQQESLREYKLEEDVTGQRGLWQFSRWVEPPQPGEYGLHFPQDFDYWPSNAVDCPNTVTLDDHCLVDSSFLTYTFASPGGVEAPGAWHFRTPQCNGSTLVSEKPQWTCGKQYMGTGQTCYGDLVNYEFRTAVGDECIPAVYNYSSGAYDILSPECYDALFSPRTVFKQFIDATPGGGTVEWP